MMDEGPDEDHVHRPGGLPLRGLTGLDALRHAHQRIRPHLASPGVGRSRPGAVRRAVHAIAAPWRFTAEARERVHEWRTGEAEADALVAWFRTIDRVMEGSRN
jgi:hypothetical protein